MYVLIDKKCQTTFCKFPVAVSYKESGYLYRKFELRVVIPGKLLLPSFLVRHKTE